jgi:peptidyl-tRNA hydrolase, PTH1 family
MKPSLLIIGLGNPGKSYEKTRHNVGFQAVDLLSDAMGEGEWELKQKFNAEVREGRIVTAPVLFVKPHTYMNASGECIRKMVDFYKLDPRNQILVISDDIDLPLGEMRLKKSGGPGTHNGLRSVTLHFGEEYPRLRIGLGDHPKGDALAAWVLSVPPKNELEIFEKIYKELPQKVKEFVVHGEK